MGQPLLKNRLIPTNYQTLEKKPSRFGFFFSKASPQKEDSIHLADLQMLPERIDTNFLRNFKDELEIVLDENLMNIYSTMQHVVLEKFGNLKEVILQRLASLNDVAF